MDTSNPLESHSTQYETQDERKAWILNHVRNTFRNNIKDDNLNKALETSVAKQQLSSFLNSNEMRSLFFGESNGTVFVCSNFEVSFNCKHVHFTKINKAPVSMTEYPQEILVGDIVLNDALHSLSTTLKEIYLPLLQNKDNQSTWPDMVGKDVMGNLHAFLANLQIMVGKSHGETCLPLPTQSEDLLDGEKDISGSVGHGKDRIHVLEGCLITWTKQIKAVLRQDPETLLNQQNQHPGPTAEIQFWKFKAQNLNSIFDQLQGEKIRKVLHYLDQSKSTYNLPFAKLCKEVFQAREEANNNTKYLTPLETWFEQLEEPGRFTSLVSLFRPLLHCILLVWKSSRFYCTSTRLVVLIREICNALIHQACDYLSGKSIFEYIEMDQTLKAVEMLDQTLNVCSSFKSCYFEYKAKANLECEENPWKIQNNALFVRLDGFLERCHDIKEFTKTIVQFSKLAKIEVGGTKGKTLTTSVHQIHSDFVDAVNVIQSVPYDIMNLDARGFDDDFYEFRSKIKELERRLASVVTQSFDDCNAVTGCLKLLDSFDDILERSIIKNELEKKHTALIASFNEDLHAVQHLFVEYRENPPISHNLPPFAGALTWSRGLIERIKTPLDKLKNLSRVVLEREDSKEALKTYTALVSNLSEFESRVIQTWAATIESSTQAKLKLSLLKREPESQVLIVNFDPALVRLLREVKYFLLLNVEIPDTALGIYRKAEVFRRQTGNLDLIVNMYNGIQNKLLPVERPLVRTNLHRIDQVLNRGLRSLNWKSHGIDLFLKESMADVTEANSLMESMKLHLLTVETLLKEWRECPIFERRSKPMVVSEFEESQVGMRARKYSAIKEGGAEIQKLLKDTLKQVKVSQGSPDWRAYVDFINTIVIKGLSEVVVISLKYLHEQLDHQNIDAEGLTPILEIELDLYGKDVVYSPDIGHSANKQGLRDIVMHWVEAILNVANMFQRLDNSEGTYLKDMRENKEIINVLAKIEECLKLNESMCLDYRTKFVSYEYLWTTDLQKMFNTFIKGAWLNTDSEGNTQHEVLDLEQFDEKIKQYLELQSEVSETKHSVDIGFVRINSQPIKQALCTWVTKWVYMFTQFLQDKVVDSLGSFRSFVNGVNAGLSIEVPQDDYDALKQCMSYIRDVRKSMESTEAMFDPLLKIVGLLKSHGITLESSYIGNENAVGFLEQAPLLWESTVNLTFKAKENIQPQQNEAVDQIKIELKKFSDRLTDFRTEFLSHGPFQYKLNKLDGYHTRKAMQRGNSKKMNETKENDEASGEMHAIDAAYVLLDKFSVKLLELAEEAENLNDLEELFELPKSKYDLLLSSEADLKLLKLGWDTASMMHFTFTEWERTPWSNVATDNLLDEVALIHSQVRKLPFPMKSWELYKFLDLSAKNMATVLPLVHDLHSNAMRERHWKSLMTITRVHFEKGATFKLQDIFRLELYRFVNEVSELVEVATREQKIEHNLKIIEESWINWDFKFLQYKETGIMLLDPPDEIIETLEEQQMQLQSMAGMGKFVEYFRERVLDWQLKLGNVESLLKLWILVQKQWSSLEAIFMHSTDIRSQLPDETKLFEQLNADIEVLYSQAVTEPNVLEACTKEGREMVVREMISDLEKCSKALNEYLDTKKNIFPRFYFVSNTSLLDILSNGNEPSKILPHIGDCFDGIKSVEFIVEADDVPRLAKSITSKDGEHVRLLVPYPMIGAVEIWLRDFVGAVQSTLKGRISQAIESASLWEVDKPRESWLFDYPAQLSLLASQIMWTEESEGAFEEIENGQDDAMKKHIEVCVGRLNSLIQLATTDLKKNDRVKVITLITIDVHARDIIQGLISKKVDSVLDFSWQSQLRYYWDNSPLENTLNDDPNAIPEAVESIESEKANDTVGPRKRDVLIRICDFQSLYSYEYIGNCGRLVITPLTDRCYVTLTTALRLVLGGAPTGPAGTGKTETTKDLARGVGLCCYVFNCSDQMNYQTMADIFKGLAQTGTWGCFDEFNRIPIEVLSVVATQIKTVLDAIGYLSNPSNREEDYCHLQAGKPPEKVGNFDFFSENIALVPTCGFFITMNPGYAGRTELPENLKALFRPCAMIRPDLEPICENMLMTEGFVNAHALAVKFVTLYEICSELLSKQEHYDWGLRSVKSVLIVAGTLRRADPGIDEEAILMRSLRDFNTPKIPFTDMPIFLGLIDDLFPTTKLPTKINSSLKETCIKVCTKRGIQAEDTFINKVVQYEELLNVRHSVMLLGPAGCGKTTVWQTLADCHNFQSGDSKDERARTVFETVNPKAVTSDELYGFMTLSKDWKDGILSILMRNMSKEWAPYNSNQTGKWIILDGDIDSVWIESMNTVMDDNMVLTLVSNERIPLIQSMRMIFEVNSLVNATPATVSRAGILYINEEDIGWQPYVDSWISARLSEKERAVLPKLVEKYVEKSYKILRDNKLGSVVPIPRINHVVTLCRILDGLLLNVSEADKTIELLENLFSFSAIWAFGGCIPNAAENAKTTDLRKEFSYCWRSAFNSVFKAGSDMTDMKSADSELVFDFFVNTETNEIVPWVQTAPEYTSMGDMAYSSVVVPTSESTRISFLIKLLVEIPKAPILLVGAAGTGKTTLIKEYLKNMDEDVIFGTINMNYFTDSKSLQAQLEQYVEKRSGRIYGPINNKSLIYFVDDLNMPLVEEYGTQTPLALLRQFMDYKGWYDRSDLGNRKLLHDAQFVAAMNHQAGSFSINSRLQRHFSTFSCSMPSSKELLLIYKAILDGHLTTFPDIVKRLSSTIVQASIELYGDIRESFLPSATKFHYNFNMRDLTNLSQGLMQSRAEYYVQPLRFIRLWIHECKRVFSDRLVTHNEIGRLNDIIVEKSKKYFEEDQVELHAEPLIFTNFVSQTMDDVPVYMPLNDYCELKRTLECKLDLYNESNPFMQLVLFQQAMQHVTRICRIISSPRGNALLVGVGGSGKQSLSKLATFICGYSIVHLPVTSKFGMNELKDSLKDLYKRAGLKPGLPIVFLLTDSQILQEKFLVYINDILSTGYILELFSAEEYDIILGSLRNIAKQNGIPVDSREHMMEFFIERVRSNLHLILAFSPVGDVFRVRARRFPALTNCTMIDWFHPWPKDALVSVAQIFLQDIDLMSPAIEENVCHHMADVHLSVTGASERFQLLRKRYNYVTPKSYLELIQFYKALLKEKRSLHARLIDRLDVGLKTLHQTAQDVGALQEDLKITMGKVEEKKKATEALLEQMGHQRSEAEAKQAMADMEREKAEAAAEIARKIEDEASVELRVAKPALDAAKDAVNCLSKASLTELKSLTKPPAGVEKVTTAVLMMVKGETKNFSWDNAKKMMAKVDAFKTTLEKFKGESMTSDIVSRVEPILQDPNFTFEKMKSKSLAAANLCVWVINMVTYHKTYRKVRPLMDALETAKKEKSDSEMELLSVESLVTEVENQLSALQASFREATNGKAKVEKEAMVCQERLSLAERLVNGLASENSRWKLEITELREKNGTLVGDVLLSAAFVSYIGAFDMEYREGLWRDIWFSDLINREIPTTSEADPLELLANDSSIATWMNEGLPADRISVENGCIITSCQRWPLLIDPQLQGIKWLRNRHSDLTVIQTSQVMWMRCIEKALVEGQVILIENIGENLDAALDPILSRSVYKKGKSWFLKLGDEEFSYDTKFQLFLQTKLPNPHYKPEVSAQCTLINFIVTENGLEDQLLEKVVNQEQPDLEREKRELQQAFNQYKIQLLDLENQLLERLARAPPDILSDVALIEGLESTKKTANEVSLAVEKGKETEQVINEAREVYRSVASEGSMLYFLMVNLHTINHMYQYSLDSFSVYFFKSMRKTVAEADDQDERVAALRESLRHTIFTVVSRGLFENHKLLFLSQITFKLLERNVVGNNSGFTPAALRFLLRGPKEMREANPTIWLPEAGWQAIQALTEVEGFDRFASDLEESEARFREWYNSSTPECEKLPLDWRDLDKAPFLKLLPIRCMRPDRMTAAMSHFISNTLPNGTKYTTCDAELNSFQVLERTFEDATPMTPIFFVLSPGTDVVADVDKLAAKNRMEKGQSYHNVALGQGQDIIAMKRLHEGHKSGHWIILNNVHLMPLWLLTLERTLDDFIMQKSHPKFRVFLSSDVSLKIPIGILNRSIKLTNEPPTGLKANLKRALRSFSADELEEVEPRTRNILFGMCYFHAIMLERKKFGPQGFNTKYPFAEGDLISSSIVLMNYMENAPSKVPWPDLRYLVGEIMYGGHIVNDFDRLICVTYLDYFLRDELMDDLQMYPYLESKDVSGTAGEPGQNKSTYSFFAPKSSLSFDRMYEHVENEMGESTPLSFGLSSNAEIAFRTESSEALFKALALLQPPERDQDQGTDSMQIVAEEKLQDILENFRELRLDAEEILNRDEERGPFQNVFLQECHRMNVLLCEISRSLLELESGFRGDLTMTNGMDEMMTELYLETVPACWSKLAYPSLRPLSTWLTDLQLRFNQLQDWAVNPQGVPSITWISGMFNPQSFLTAILQSSSQKNKIELDKLVITTEITKRDTDSTEGASRDGQFIRGLCLEGARWDVASSSIETSHPKEMYCLMPVINCRAVLSDRKEQANVFECPVYRTQQRGPTYVFTAHLRTKATPAKWVLASAALIMDII